MFLTGMQSYLPHILSFVAGALTAGVIATYYWKPYRKGYFASHSSDDKWIVDQFWEALRVADRELIRDTIHVQPGDDIWDKIYRLIRKSKGFLLFWSENSVGNANVEREWKYAHSLRRKRFIRVVSLEKSSLTLLPTELRHIKYIPIELAIKDGVNLSRSWLPSRRAPSALLVLLAMSVVLSVMAATFFLSKGLQRYLSRSVQTYPSDPIDASPSIDSKPTLPGLVKATPTPKPTIQSFRRERPTSMRQEANGKQRPKSRPETRSLENDFWDKSEIYGMVVDESRTPIPGAKIRVSSDSDIQAETNAQGRYILAVNQGEQGTAEKCEVEVQIPDPSNGGRMATSKVETWNTGELNFILNENGQVLHTYRWHPLVSLNRVTNYTCSEKKQGSICTYGFSFRNFGGLARQVRLRITVPLALDVESISLVGTSNKGTIINKVGVEQRLVKRTRASSVYAINVERLSSEETDAGFATILTIQTHLRKDATSEDLHITAQLMSYLNERGIKKSSFCISSGGLITPCRVP